MKRNLLQTTLAIVSMFFAFCMNAQTTYNGNGNAGFGAPVGGSSLVFNDDGTTINGTFTKGVGDFNDDMVIYIDSKPGGFTSTQNFDDGNPGDKLRRAIAGFGSFSGSSRSVVNFPPGFEADYAIAINKDFGGLWELVENASFPFITGVGNPPVAQAAAFNFNFDWSQITGNSTDGFRFLVTYLDGFGGNGVFRSDEAYGDGLPFGNPGTSDVSFTTYFDYPTGNKGGVANTVQAGNWSDDNTWVNGNPPFSSDAVAVLHDVALDQDFFSSNSLNVDPNASLAIEAVLSAEDATISFDGDVVFKSDNTITGSLGQVTNTSITGAVTVERFIPAKRAFRFLSSSVDAGSIFDHWQEGGSSPAGFGTHITGGALADGFDQSGSNNPSIFGWNNAGQSWTNLANTNAINLMAGVPYRIFVRGDRSVNLNINDTPNNTILRATGSLRTGDVPVNGLNSTDGTFNFIGNPYQSAVNMGLVLADAANTNHRDDYFVWDPTLNVRGAYTTITASTGGNINSSSSATNTLQPGQAVFLQSGNAGTTALTFKESHKDPNSSYVPVFSQQAMPRLQVSLHQTASGPALDAAALFMDAGFNNAVDAQDAGKLINPDETIAFDNNGDLLSIERRSLPTQSEVIGFYTDRYQLGSYALKVTVSDFNGLNIALVDNYAQTTQNLTAGANDYSFSIDNNDPASIATDRFAFVVSSQTLSVGEVDLAGSIRMYPNPYTNRGSLILSVSPEITSLSVAIYNMLGQSVYQQDFSDLSGELSIQPGHLTSGLYHVILKNSDFQVVKKLIIK
ncbi:MAG: T9SS type A sorting domain-containing protein [Flavobacteriaceae bacterium]|nr:T9SS type A sorting domain-containing protein [Flavobacteriaceae bacterium]